jgi:hypothetical protein
MPQAKASVTAKAKISAKVTRADGTVEDLGVIADVGPDDANAVVKLLRKIKDKVS